MPTNLSEMNFEDTILAYAKDKQDTEPKYLNCPDTWLHKGIYADYEVKEKKPEPEVTEPEDDEPGINLWDSKEE